MSSILPRVPKQILAVEDNITNQKILVKQLEPAGYSCHLANNGQEALEISKSSKFDLILMDIEMPVMGGLEATQAIRKREEESHAEKQIPIIGISAYATDEMHKQAKAVGMNDYITKPYERNKLLQTIHKWIEIFASK